MSAFASNQLLQLVAHVVRPVEQEVRNSRYLACKERGVDLSFAVATHHGEMMNFWRIIIQEYDRDGCVPNAARLREFAPNSDLPTVELTDYEFTATLRSVVSQRARKQIEAAREDFQGEITPEAFAELARRTQQAADLVNFTSRNNSSNMEDIDATIAWMTTGRKHGLPWPWPYLNKQTFGIHPSDFIIITAVYKSGKTWLSLRIALTMIEAGKKVLFFSQEMAGEELKARLLAMKAAVSWNSVHTGELTCTDVRAIHDAAAWFKSTGYLSNITFARADKPDGTVGGPAEVSAAITKHAPDCTILDSYYQLVSNDKVHSSDVGNLVEVTSKLRDVALKTKCPIICNTQDRADVLMKSNDPYDESAIALHKGIVRDATLAVRLVGNKTKRAMSIYPLASRNGGRFEPFTISFDVLNQDYAQLSTEYTYNPRDGHADALAAKEAKANLAGAMTERLPESVTRKPVWRPQAAAPTTPTRTIIETAEVAEIAKDMAEDRKSRLPKFKRSNIQTTRAL